MSAKGKAPHLFLPDSAREAMRVPLGPVVQEDELEAHLKGAKILASVGDMVTLTLVNAGYDISLALFDYKTMRNDERDFRERLRRMDGGRVRVRNPPAMITRELWDALRTAFSAIKAGGNVRIEVEGEEDLAAIPAIMMAPDGARVLYGMPGRGIVVVTVDDRARKEAKNLLEMMEPREGWKDI